MVTGFPNLEPSFALAILINLFLSVRLTQQFIVFLVSRTDAYFIINESKFVVIKHQALSPSH
jgi:hypothetical protein